MNEGTSAYWVGYPGDCVGYIGKIVSNDGETIVARFASDMIEVRGPVACWHLSDGVAEVFSPDRRVSYTPKEEYLHNFSA